MRVKFQYYREFAFDETPRFTLVIKDSDLIVLFLELLKSPTINVKTKKAR